MYWRGSTWSYVSDVIRRIATQTLQMYAKINEDFRMFVLVGESLRALFALPKGVGINFA